MNRDLTAQQRAQEWERWCGADVDASEHALPLTAPRVHRYTPLPTGRELATIREYPYHGEPRDCRVIRGDNDVAYVTTPGVGAPIGIPLPCADLTDEQTVAVVVMMLEALWCVESVEVL